MRQSLRKIAVRLWHDEHGAVLSMELLLIGTILVIGLIVGLSSVRDAVVTELADLAQAIANLNQSYSYSSVVGHGSYSGGGSFVDLFDFCDTVNSFDRDRVQKSKCVDVCRGAFSEGENGY